MPHVNHLEMEIKKIWLKTNNEQKARLTYLKKKYIKNIFS